MWWLVGQHAAVVCAASSRSSRRNARARVVLRLTASATGAAGTSSKSVVHAGGEQWDAVARTFDG